MVGTIVSAQAARGVPPHVLEHRNVVLLSHACVPLKRGLVIMCMCAIKVRDRCNEADEQHQTVVRWPCLHWQSCNDIIPTPFAPPRQFQKLLTEKEVEHVTGHDMHVTPTHRSMFVRAGRVAATKAKRHCGRCCRGRAAAGRRRRRRWCGCC